MDKKSISASRVAMGIIAIVAGLLVLIWPGLVRWIVGISLIFLGVLAIKDRK